MKSLFPIFLLFAFIGIAFGQEPEENDTLKYPFTTETGGLFLDNQIEYDIVYDPVRGVYILYPKIGGISVGQPIYMDSQTYLDMILKRDIDSYYKDKSRSYDQMYRSNAFGDKNDNDGNILPSLRINSRAFETIFGGNEIQLIPQGSAQLDLGLFIQKIDNPQLLPQNRNTLTIDLQQRIQMSVLGKVGENLQLKANYDTQAGFGFENQMKLQWKNMKDGGEDDIVQNIEVGNISMPLNTSLITGAQSLFGVRTDLRFGRTDVSMVFSEQRSESKNITVQGGGVLTDYRIFAEDYDYNRHYFLGHFFRNNYDNALVNYPQIASDIVITRMEVWRIDNGGANQQNRRSILALRDLGDEGGAPNNGPLYGQVSAIGGIREASTARNVLSSFNYGGQTYQEGEHFLVNENVRKLDQSEYTFYPSLGYISLNQPLVDGEDLLAVSFQYTRNSTPGVIYKVGEMSDEQNQLLIAKLIKPNTTVNIASPMWDLMMKNIYSINALTISPEDFIMNVEFKDNSANSSGVINYLPNTPVSDQTLLQVMNMDRLNQNGNLQMSGNGHYGDGIFDFVNGITINPQQGTIIFTKVEPFGQHLANVLGDPNSPLVFKEIYRQLPNTLDAERLAQRYSLAGRYKGEVGGGIPLGAFNVPEGSVKVTANGMELIEGVDYTVDYQLGQVTILNEQLKNSGVPINISLENQSTFNMQKKRFMGLNVDHRFSDNFLVGGTVVNYQERPLTQKVQFGSEPVSNTIFGLHTEYTGESEFLTRLTNKIPGIKTDQISQITFSAEGAYLMPGQNSSTGGNSYIDDFEDSQSRISLMDAGSWKLSSVPGKPAGYGLSTHPYFPNGTAIDNLDYGNGRRLMSWYSIDPRFYGIGGNSPSGISDAELSKHRVRRVELKELFDQRDVMAGTMAYINTFDMTFFPELVGPYNVNPNALDTQNWGGTMRPISVTNFIDSNIEYLEFWMMDPYADGVGGNGDLIIQLGNVSEDILKDGKMLYENGLPHSNNGAATSETTWGKQPQNYPIIYAYETEGAARKEQDLGYNGLTDEMEAAAYGLTNVNPVTGQLDPASDNYVYYLDDRWNQTADAGSITKRYKYFNLPQGNNSTDDMLHSYSMQPDAEDINLDFNLDQTEMYNQYTLKISPSDLTNNTSNYVVATKESTVSLPNGQTSNIKWYQVRIPVDSFDRDIDGDGIPDVDEDAAKSVLTSARFMRVLMRGFDQETTLRFATMDLVRSNWRRYPKTFHPIPGSTSPEEGVEADPNLQNLEIGQVTLEENSTNQPPYMLPPGIEREEMQGTTGYQSQNEASMVLKAKLNANSPSKGVFKNTNLDLRRYKRMEMFVHAENLLDVNSQEIDETTKLFIRLGSDYSDNYYEYEMPLKYTPKTANTVNAIWPEENMVDILTDYFVEAKKARDLDPVSNPMARFGFVPNPEEPNKTIYVKGRPSLGSVTSVMIGLRSTNSQDKEVLVWVNELRLSEIDNSGGYAAMASLGFTLGDFAQVQVSGSVSSAGFGAIDQGPTQRSQEDYRDYALNAQIKLDKFTPKNWGLEIPFNVSISEQFSDPKYNPLDNDILFDEDPRRDELKDVVRTYSQQKSFTFSNIRKIKTNNKPARFYDASNFALSFMYADQYMRDVYTAYNLTKNVKASLNYNYSFPAKPYRPFKDWRAVQDTARSAKYLKFIKEFNINPLPTRFSFTTDIDRIYSERQYRDLNQFYGSNSSYLFPVAFSNNFLFNWRYNIGFDLTKSLRLDYTSSTRTLNDGAAFEYADKALIWNDLFRVGRPVNYDHQIQLNWKTPLHLFPYMNWTNLEVGVSNNYNWQARSSVFLNAPNTNGQGLGNIAQNMSSFNLIGDFDFNKFYNEFKGFTKLDSIKRGRKREIDSLTRAYDGMTVKALNRIKKNHTYKTQFRAQDYAWMVVSSIKRFQFNYTQTNGAVIPGILSEPNFFGWGKDGGPSAGFIYGTEFDIKRRFIESGNDWITRSDQLLEPYIIDRGTNFTANSLIEPFPNLRIDLNARRNSSFRSTETGFNLRTYENPQWNTYIDRQESLSSSNISISTAFMDPDSMYETFLGNAQVISQRLGMANGMAPLGDGFYEGYGLSNYDVLIPAFKSAVEGTNPEKTSLGHNRKIPLPNWGITYSGLTNVPLVKRYFSVFDITHNYISSYTVNGIQSNPNHFMDPMGRDLDGNFYSENLYGTVNMIESFSPLIGVDMTFRNSLQLRAQYNRDRMMTMSLSNYSLTEDYGTEYVLGMGYVIKDLKFKMRYQGRNKTFTGDLNFRLDGRMRDSETRIRRILENDSQVIGGQKLFSLMFSADYGFSKNLNLKFFWDQMITEYKISTAYPISTIRTGLSLTLNFGN
ncbi:cell surface protein SprA [Moheibacter stercoris]|uniref:Cell surface protein SprA n=1 Tax=Moheibacter stercoris TaxID=1628251 RepID=A0ABV2LVY3_9FLAO